MFKLDLDKCKKIVFNESIFDDEKYLEIAKYVAYRTYGIFDSIDFVNTHANINLYEFKKTDTKYSVGFVWLEIDNLDFFQISDGFIKITYKLFSSKYYYNGSENLYNDKTLKKYFG